MKYAIRRQCFALFALAVAVGVLAGEESAEEMFKKAGSFSMKQHDNALQVYREIAETHRDTEWAVKSQDMIAFIYAFCKRDYDMAIQEYEKLAQQYPETRRGIEASYMLADIYRSEKKESQTAFSYYKKFHIAFHAHRDLFSDKKLIDASRSAIGSIGTKFVSPKKVPKKGEITIGRYEENNGFTVWFEPEKHSTISLKYDVEGNWKIFVFSGAGKTLMGCLTVSAEGMVPPIRVYEEGKLYEKTERAGMYLIINNIKSNAKYELRGLEPGEGLSEGEEEDLFR